MKKTLLALAVLAAGSANAGVNLYDQDGVLVDLSAAAEVQLGKRIAAKDATNDFGVRLDDGDLALNTTIAVTNQLNAVGGIAFAFEANTSDDNTSNTVNDELWVGFDSADFGTITVGRQLLIVDDSGIGKDYELGTEQIGFATTEGDETVKYVFDNGQFYFGISHDFDAQGTDFQGNDGTVTDGRIGARFGDIDVRAYYYTDENDAGTAESDGYNLEGEYVMGAFAFAASYGNIEKDVNGATSSDIDAIEVNGSYTVGKNTFALGYARLDDSVADDTADNIYANVTHKLHSNVKVYAELGWADADKRDLDTGYILGMEVLF